VEAVVVVIRPRSHGGIRGALTAACALAGIHASAVEATEVQGAALYYAEPSRVTAVEAIVEGRHEFVSGRSVSLKFLVDVLTGASANGAVPSTQVQTFTRPSGAGSYTIAPGDTPLDDTFHDARGALHAGVTQPINRLTSLSGGLNASIEHDYLSFGGNASMTREFNKRNTALNLGVSYSHDIIRPEGGRPIAFASMAPAEQPQPRLKSDGQKDVLDFMAGVSQVINRSTIAQISYSLSHLNGYQTDPYKIVSLVDAVTGDPLDQLYESRPESRTKHVLFGQMKHHLSRDIADASYRFLVDDWGILSHTVDLNYRLQFQPHRYVQPHVRFYHQTEADFYRRWLPADASGMPVSLPENVTADYRLGRFQAWTVGGRYGQALRPGQSLLVRVEHYWQMGDSHPPGAPGALAHLDLFPTVGAWIVNAGYSIGF
jgi:hypothetical protein